MTAQELLDQFRRDCNDQAAPYLWDDEELLRWLNDAQLMFARKTEGIADASTPAVVEVEAAADEPLSDLHPSILRIRTAVRGDGKPIRITSFEDLITERRLPTTSGEIVEMVIGMEENKARWVNIPTEDETITLTVFRLPLQVIDADTLEDELEIAAEHHLHLLLWVKRHAYLKQDSETYAPKSSEAAEMAFERYCKGVKNEQGRKRAKVRVVRYGGL